VRLYLRTSVCTNRRDIARKFTIKICPQITHAVFLKNFYWCWQTWEQEKVSSLRVNTNIESFFYKFVYIILCYDSVKHKLRFLMFINFTNIKKFK